MAREKTLSTCQLFHCSVYHGGNLDVRLFGLLFSLSILMNTSIRLVELYRQAGRQTAANRCFLAKASIVLDFFGISFLSKQISVTSAKVRHVPREGADDEQMTSLVESEQCESS